MVRRTIGVESSLCGGAESSSDRVAVSEACVVQKSKVGAGPKTRARGVERLGETLAGLPPTQKRTSLKKWHKVLGELRSMSLAMPGACHLFSHMQRALALKLGGWVTLTHDVHRALDDFK